MAKLLVILVAVLAFLVWNDSTRQHLPGFSKVQQAGPIHYVSAYNDALLIVDGTNGRGSGFLCQMQGRTVAITNAHVAASNTRFQLINLQGTSLTVRESAVAVGHDIVKMTPSDPAFAGKGFPLMENVERNANIGDSVLVLGNAEGAKVVTTLKGKIVGIGPNLVEVDAPFVPGNSGSPIIHEKTGTVIGVATYLLLHNVDQNAKDGISENVRRFGYRLDSVKTWEPIDWQRFCAQAEQVERIEHLSKDFITLFKNSRVNHSVAGAYQTLPMQRAVQALSQRGGGVARLDGQDRRAVFGRFLGELQFISRADVNAFDSAHAYDYFRHRLEEQVRLREAVYTGISRAIEANR